MLSLFLSLSLSLSFCVCFLSYTFSLFFPPVCFLHSSWFLGTNVLSYIKVPFGFASAFLCIPDFGHYRCIPCRVKAFFLSLSLSLSLLKVKQSERKRKREKKWGWFTWLNHFSSKQWVTWITMRVKYQRVDVWIDTSGTESLDQGSLSLSLSLSLFDESGISYWEQVACGGCYAKR